MRAVLDPNVLIAALLAPNGTPAALILRWLAGDFELVVSQQLLEELERALGYPKIRARIAGDDAAAFIELLRTAAEFATDPPKPPLRSADPGDDYLLGLAEAEDALLISGDKHLLDVAGQFPVRAPREFFDSL